MQVESVSLHKGRRQFEVTWSQLAVEVCEDAVVSTFHFPTPRGAEEFALDRVAGKRDEGFVDGVPEPLPPVPEPDLTTIEGRVIWGDLLLERGEVLGELIALQAAKHPGAAACLQANGPALLGLAGFYPELVQLEWEAGQIVSAVVHASEVCSSVLLVEELLDSPCARVLSKLDLRAHYGGSLSALLQGLQGRGSSVRVLHLYAMYAEDDLFGELPEHLDLIELGLGGELFDDHSYEGPAAVVQLAENWQPPEIDDAVDMGEDGMSGDVLDFGASWEPEQLKRLESYEDDPGVEQEDGMPALGSWKERGEPTEREYDDDLYERW